VLRARVAGGDRLVGRGLHPRQVDDEVRAADLRTCAGDSSRSCGSAVGGVRLATATWSPPTRSATYSNGVERREDLDAVVVVVAHERTADPHVVILGGRLPGFPAPHRLTFLAAYIDRCQHRDMSIQDVVIVGSGPAGYTAAIYAARAGLAPLVLAGSVTAGGALMNTTEVENFPGFPDGIMGPELMESMRKQAERFGARVEWDDATLLDLEGPVKTVVTGNGETYRARAVILATGSAYRELGLDDEKRLSGRGVSWCATCDGFFFRDQHIAVVGGGDSAVEEATFLTRFAEKVTLVHRREELRASKIMADRAKNDPKIEFAWNSEVAGIDGEKKVEALTLRDTVTGQERELGATGLFVAIGHEPRTELVKGQIDLDDEGYIQVVGRTTATNLEGVFACGDAVDHTYRQAITAAGSGCAAALDAQRYLTELADAAGLADLAGTPETPNPDELPLALEEIR
jgi:thioredoxin reductase (NADPH)